MIGLLRGRVEEIGEGQIVLLCGAVGYEVLVPSGPGMSLPLLGEETTLHVRTIVRQDAITLCGFQSLGDKAIFDRLTTIQGVGARLALAALGALGGQGLLDAAASGDIKAIQSVPGIGKKTAERVLLELRDRIDQLGGVSAAPLGQRHTIDQALSALGFKRSEIDAVLAQLKPEPGTSEESLVRQALQILNRGRRAQ